MYIRNSQPIKYSVHKTVTRKLVSPPRSKNQGGGGFSAGQTPRVVRISVTDGDATESSGDECEHANVRRVRKHVSEIRVEMERVSTKKSVQERNTNVKKKAVPENREEGNEKKYRGVRRRPWGRYSAEIRNPALRTRVWLGTFATAEEAAVVYDEAAIRIRGPDATTNIIRPPQRTPQTAAISISGDNSGREESCENLSSPTSVLLSRFKNGRNDDVENQKAQLARNSSSFVMVGDDVDLLTDDCLPLDQCFLNDYFDFRSPSPLIYNEINVPEVVSGDDIFDGVDFELGDDFGSLTWDVNEFLEDQFLVG